MAEEIRAVVVDTYAIMADLVGDVTPNALKALERVRKGITKGIIHYLIVYELSYHWRKGRLPFIDDAELKEFIKRYFIFKPLTYDLALRASEIKILGDKLLRESNDVDLTRRRLSSADATSLALAERLRIPIVTGDKDLSYVAKKLGIGVVW